MIDYAAFAEIPPPDIAGCVERDNVMDIGIRELWQGSPRIAGPAFTVQCAPGDHLMLHAAIYEAAPGDILVVQGGDVDYALAGGNVCAIAKQRGILGMVIDGVVRDIGEARELEFPIFARGVIPYPATKKVFMPLNQPIVCGGAKVHDRDVVIADEEGIVVVPQAQAELVLTNAQAAVKKETEMSLAEWQAEHFAKVTAAVQKSKH